MKTLLLFLSLFTAIQWGCTKPDASDESPAIPVNTPAQLQKREPDPLLRQFRRFSFDVKTGKYMGFPAYQKDGC